MGGGLLACTDMARFTVTPASPFSPGRGTGPSRGRRGCLGGGSLGGGSLEGGSLGGGSREGGSLGAPGAWGLVRCRGTGGGPASRSEAAGGGYLGAGLPFCTSAGGQKHRKDFREEEEESTEGARRVYSVLVAGWGF